MLLPDRHGRAGVLVLGPAGIPDLQNDGLAVWLMSVALLTRSPAYPSCGLCTTPSS